MDPKQSLSKKIALLGDFGVGKTSLISRFVEGKFSESYVTTIGLKVDKKMVDIGDKRLDLLVWDIAGNENPHKMPQYYLTGCKGIIYVTDLSRPATYLSLRSQVEMVRGMMPDADFLVVGNKKDLYEVSTLKTILDEYPVKPDLLVSALSGENVEEMFLLLARNMLQSHESRKA